MKGRGRRETNGEEEKVKEIERQKPQRREGTTNEERREWKIRKNKERPENKVTKLRREMERDIGKKENKGGKLA